MVKTCHLAEAVLGNATEDSRKTVHCLLDLIRCVHKGGWQLISLQEDSLVGLVFYFFIICLFFQISHISVFAQFCLFLKVNILIRIRTITLSVCF